MDEDKTVDEIIGEETELDLAKEEEDEEVE